MEQIHKSVLNDIFDQLLGQTYDDSLSDVGGCYMGRSNHTWMSPQLITQIVQEVLDAVGVETVDDTNE